MLQAGALAHSPRSPASHHRHLATRDRLAGQIGAQEQKRHGGLKINKRGQTCRARPSSASSTALAASGASAGSADPSAASSTNAADAVAVSAAADPSAAAVSPSPSYSPTTSWSPPASTAPAAASASSSNGNLLAVNVNANVGVSLSWPSGNSGWTGGWTNTGSKFGAGWPNGNWAQSSDPNYIGNYIGSRTAWYYTWSPDNVGSADSIGLEFVPMLWGPAQESDFWNSQATWPSSVKNALFFNEPNEPSQCNMAASDSVSYWMNDMVPLRGKGIAIGGAATTSAPSGLQWVQAIIQDCQNDGNSQADCTPDFVPIHYYDVDVNNFQSYVANFHQQTGLDIWITEYACQNFNGGAQCDSGTTWNMHQSMAAWFDSQDYVKRYAPFGMMENMQGVNQMNALMNPDGSISDLGGWVSCSFFCSA